MARGEGTSGKRLILIACAVAAVCAVALALGLGLGLGLKKDDKAAAETEEVEEQHQSRVDCYPELRWGVPPNDIKAACESRGCTYDPSVIDELVPVCFISPDCPLGSGYSVTHSEETDTGMTLTLQSRLSTKDVVQRQSTYRIEPTELALMVVEYLGENSLRIKVNSEMLNVDLLTRICV
jgi:hypothetical protein